MWTVTVRARKQHCVHVCARSVGIGRVLVRMLLCCQEHYSQSRLVETNIFVQRMFHELNDPSEYPRCNSTCSSNHCTDIPACSPPSCTSCVLEEQVELHLGSSEGSLSTWNIHFNGRMRVM
jgi:hypothetical protein